MSLARATQSELRTELFLPARCVVQRLASAVPPLMVLQSERSVKEWQLASASQLRLAARTHSGALAQSPPASCGALQLQCAALHTTLDTHAASLRVYVGGAVGQPGAAAAPIWVLGCSSKSTAWRRSSTRVLFRGASRSERRTPSLCFV